MSGFELSTLIPKILILLIAFPIHELAHAVTATWFGDDTPERAGRLTLNPLAHLDVLGSLLLLVSFFGWAKPVPVNPYNLQRRAPSAMMWVSLAGPFSNLLLAILAAIPFKLGLVSIDSAFSGAQTIFPSFGETLVMFIYINLALLFFNLIPLDPLDGAKILEYLLPGDLARAYERIRPYSPVILMVLVFGGAFMGFSVISAIIGPPIEFLFRLLVI